MALLAAAAPAYLAAEAIQPPDRQPTARACLAAIHAYRQTGSPLMKLCGVRCRYSPTCSAYAEEAVAHYGTVEGLIRAAGRLFRCAPWGGCGWDPAVETQQPTTRQEEDARRHREEMKKAAEEMKKAQEEMEKSLRALGKETGKAAGACAAGCIISIIAALALFAANILAMIWMYKDGKARGDSNSVLWVILEFLFPPIGLIVYLVARPKGDLTPCGNCHNKRLPTLAKCPHCGGEAGPGGAAAK